MSVKAISPTQVYEIRSAQEKKSQQSSSEKDPNGQSYQGDSQQKKFSEEEVKKAVSKIKNLNGVKDNNLDVHYKFKGYVYVVYVTDMTGKVVRRIPEQELSLYLDQDESKPSGHILNKVL